MTSVIKYIPNNSTPEEAIKKYSKCDCCYSHKNNKPHKLIVWEELNIGHANILISNKDINNVRKCYCNCRHMSRFICRKYSNEA